MSKTVTVGISDLNVVKAPDTLVTYALGSCVGICMYDPVTKVAGLSHIMLPSSSLTGSDAVRQYRDSDAAEKDGIRGGAAAADQGEDRGGRADVFVYRQFCDFQYRAAQYCRGETGARNAANPDYCR